MEILLGMLGAGIGAGLFLWGVWWGRSLTRAGKPAVQETPDEVEERRRREDKQAFEALMGYSAAVAYGETRGEQRG